MFLSRGFFNANFTNAPQTAPIKGFKSISLTERRPLLLPLYEVHGSRIILVIIVLCQLDPLRKLLHVGLPVYTTMFLFSSISSRVQPALSYVVRIRKIQQDLLLEMTQLGGSVIKYAFLGTKSSKPFWKIAPVRCFSFFFPLSFSHLYMTEMSN